MEGSRRYSKLEFSGLWHEMQNSKCKVQNCGVSFGNDLKISAKPIPSFCILHFAFCIGQVILLRLRVNAGLFCGF